MWFLNFIPDSWYQIFIHGVVIVGLVLYVIGAIGKKIPFISQYGILVKIIGSILFVAGIFFEGGYGVEMSWRAKVAEMQAKVAIAEEQSKQANTQIANKVQERTIFIKEKVAEDAKEIEQNRDAIDSECKLSDTAWMLYNRAVAPKIPAGAPSTTGASTGPK